MQVPYRRIFILCCMTASLVISLFVFFDRTPLTTDRDHAEQSSPPISQDQTARSADHHIDSASYGPSNRTTSAQDSVQARSISREVQAARQELLQIKQEMQALAKPDRAKNLVEQITPEQMLELAERKAQAQQRLFEESFAAEEIDPNWSIDIKEQVAHKLKNINQIQVSKLECASTMCQLTANANATKDVTQIYREMSEHLAWQGEMHISMNQETGLMTAYLAKPGKSLPRAEEVEN